jgi:CubicO group peptidase (beta-lactamase class C family)
MLFMHERRHACTGRQCVMARIFITVAIAWALVGALIMILGREAAAQAAPAPWARALDSLVNAELARTGTPGAQVAVVAGGKLVYSSAFGIADIETKRPVTPRTLFRVGSVTKMVTAAALTQMASQGTVDLQAPIGRYVPEIAGKRVANVTTHQLLSHSAGWLDNATAYGRMGEGALGEVFREITDTLFFTEPGRIISYSNPGYSMAGYVTEKAGKARYADIVDQLVIKKMGMPRATFRPLQALTHDFSHGHVGPTPVIVRPFTENTAQWAAGFLFTSAEEMARFTIALMDGGKLDGQQVLAPEAIAMMTTGHVAIPGAEDKYGYGLRIGTVNGQRVWAHGGSINGFDAQVTMFPDRQVAVLVFDNRSGSPLRGVVDAAARHAAGIVPAPAPAALPEPRDATAAERAAMLGTYRNGTVTLELAEQDGKLVLKQGANVMPARLVGSDRISARNPQGNAVSFLLVKDSTGKVEYLHGGLRSLGRLP